MGRMAVSSRQGQFAVVFCHVGQYDTAVWVVARDNGNKVGEILDQRIIPNWRRAELTSLPALRMQNQPPARPKKAGLLSTIRKSFSRASRTRAFYDPYAPPS